MEKAGVPVVGVPGTRVFTSEPYKEIPQAGPVIINPRLE